MKRTGIDFSKHELTIVENELITIHWLKIPDLYQQNIKFSNIEGNLVVTGDFGNWIFCRNFYPVKGETISDGYWCEKIKIYSEQNPYVFDSETTKKELEFQIETGLEDYGYTDSKLEEMKEYMTECLEYVEESKEIYEAFAYQNLPSFTDYESVVCIKDVHPYLKCIFDGFEEICNRID